MDKARERDEYTHKCTRKEKRVWLDFHSAAYFIIAPSENITANIKKEF